MTAYGIDQAILFGKQSSLVGILTKPREPIRQPTVVFLNTGITHRIGHHRVYVELSRNLGSAGYTTFRFDLSGIGDSYSRREPMSTWESAALDIKEAIDWLQLAQKTDQIVLVGLCSGADHGVLYASSDPRVVGVILLDPTIPRTPRYYSDYLLRRLRRPRSWFNVFWGSRSHMRTIIKGNARLLLDRARGKPAMPDWKMILEHAYRGSVTAGTKLLAIFTEGRGDSRQTYREQILEGFPNVSFGDKLQLEYFRECDHTFMYQPDRKLLAEVVLDWLRNANFRSTAPEFVQPYARQER